MALVKTFDANDLLQEFKDWNRDYYSYEACEAMVQFFEETDCDHNTELDIVALCCDFNEASPEDILNDYDHLSEFEDVVSEDGDIDEDALLDALNYYTWAVKLDNGNILYASF